MTIFPFLGKKIEKEICPGLHASHRFMCMSSSAWAASNLAQSFLWQSTIHRTTVTFITIHLIFYCPVPLIQMLCAVLLAFKKWTPRANWGKFSPNMGLRSDLKQDSMPVFLCVLRFFLTHLLALLCLVWLSMSDQHGRDLIFHYNRSTCLKVCL